MVYKLIKEDLKQGIWRRKAIFIITFLIMTVMSVLIIKNWMVVRKFPGSVGVGDIICYIFRGMEEYVPSPTESFSVEERYITWVLIAALVIGHYPVRDIKGVGRNYMIQSGKKVYWWISKCVWCIASSVIYTLSIFAGALAGTGIAKLMFKNVSVLKFSINPKIFNSTFAKKLSGSGTDIVIKLIVLLFLAFIALSAIQMMFMFIGNAIVGYMSVIVAAVLSAYYMADFLPGNAIMVFRYMEINNNGIHMLSTALWCIAITLVSMILGFMVFKRKDVM